MKQKHRFLLALSLLAALLFGTVVFLGTANQASANPKLLISIPYGDCGGNVTVHIDNPDDWPGVPITVKVQFADNTFYSEDGFNVDANVQDYPLTLAVPNDGRAFRYAVVGTGDTIWTDLSCGYEVYPTDTPYVYPTDTPYVPPADTPTPTCTTVPPTNTPEIPENTPTATATTPSGETPTATSTPRPGETPSATATTPSKPGPTSTPGKTHVTGLPNTGVGPSNKSGGGLIVALLIFAVGLWALARIRRQQHP